MAAGDWVTGTTLRLVGGTNVAITANGFTVTADWYAVLPSGQTVFPPGGSPFTYTADPAAPVENQLVAFGQALANAQGAPVVLPDGTTVNPA